MALLLGTVNDIMFDATMLQPFDQAHNNRLVNASERAVTVTRKEDEGLTVRAVCARCHRCCIDETEREDDTEREGDATKTSRREAPNGAPRDRDLARCQANAWGEGTLPLL